MKIKDVNESEMDDFLCEFLRQMLDKTENRDEIERAVSSLNDTLYEYGGSKSMCYDRRDGSAFIAG